MSGIRLGARGLDALRDETTGRDLAIVRQVAELRLMSARQIEAIHFTTIEHASALTAARCCRRVLERLVRDRLLVRLQRRVGGIRAGSASFVYALGPVGQRLIESGTQPRRRFREPSSTFASHTLAVAQLVVDVTAAARRGDLELLGMQTEPTCWRRFQSGLAGAATVRPDLFAILGVGDFAHRWFVEVDLGSEHLPTLLRKCLAYEAYYRAGVEQHAHGVFPRVLWIMRDTERVDRLQSAIQGDDRLSDGLLVVASTDQALDVLRGAKR